MQAALSLSAFAAIVVIASANPSAAQTADPVAPFRAQREAVLEGFRGGGKIDTAKLEEATSGLKAVAQSASGEMRARALMELGTVLRMSNDHQGAIAAQTEAARTAEALGLSDLAFDAWIGVSRADVILADHGSAALAYDRAVDAAGEQPSEKQRATLAGFRAELEIERGELDAGVIDALNSIRLTRDPKDRLYREFDLAEGLVKLVESCDYRPLLDAKSSEDGDDVYGACRRAVAAARAAYEQAASTAASLGWTHVANETRFFESDVDKRGKLIDMRASFEKKLRASKVNVFHPRSSHDVMVGRNFESRDVVGASNFEAGLPDRSALAPLIEAQAAETKAKTGRQDARSEFLLGLAKDIGHAPPEVAARYFAEAAGMLEAERNGFFDPRRRGTAIEDRGVIILRLALRLLSLGREADAFAAFESVRARGLAELTGALARPDISADNRRWLADLLVIEAKASRIERKIVAELVASGRPDAQADGLQALDELRAERQAKLKSNEATRARFDLREPPPSVSLGALQAAAASAKVPVLLYWTTEVNVIAWYVGPDGSDVRTVFLPAYVLEDKVRNVVDDRSRGSKPFDETTARELFLYVLGPFSARLNAASVHEIVIVPQGALAALPFEALIDPDTGASVVDRWAVSYAPNATMAIAALQRQARPVRSVAALVDPKIDGVTGETTNIRASGVELDTVSRSELFVGSWRTDGLHILTHGDFDPNEALLSSLTPTRGADPPIEAAELISLPLGGVRLVVLSACEGGRVGARISGEIYGFPWALLAGGAEATVLSRWDVNGESNGKWIGVFYREVASGAPVSLAAATAMREMRKSGLTHPYYWAAMQVSGR